jgi:DNA-binding MarR family transcriptional regulator
MNKIEDVILFQIDLTSKISKQYSQREFDRLNLNITVEQWIIIKIISESSELSQKDLAIKSHRDPASITRTIDLLEKKQLVQRKPIPNNRRAYNICLTNKGDKFIKENIELVNSHRKKSIKGLSKKELILLSSFLATIRNNME